MVQPMLGGEGGFYPFEIPQSAMFDDGTPTYTRKTFSTDTCSTKWTFSTWVRIGNITATAQYMLIAYPSSTYYSGILFQATTSQLRFYQISGGAFQADIVTTQKFRDNTSWYHIFIAHDSTLAIAADRVQMWVNGVRITEFSTADLQNENNTSQFFINGEHTVGYGHAGSGFDGFMAEYYAINGYVKEVTDFGMFKKGIWIPRKYTGGDYGTNGFYLDFADSSNFGKDMSGNGNDFTDSGFGTDHQTLDTPTNTFPTFNPLAEIAAFTMADACIKAYRSTASWYTNLLTHQFPKTGKWYMELDIGSDVTYVMFGMANNFHNYYYDTTRYLGQNVDHCVSCGASGLIRIYKEGTGYLLTEHGTATTYDLLLIAYDADAGDVYYGWHDTSEGISYWIDSSWGTTGDPATGTNPTVSGLDTMYDGIYTPGVSLYEKGGYAILHAGQQGFIATPPTGFVALCTANMPEPSSAAFPPSKGTDVILYSGDNTDGRDISGLDFQPNLVWIKNRNVAQSNRVYDSVRGPSKPMYSDLTNVEASLSYGLSAFNSDGFQVGASDGYVNITGSNYVAWCLKKGPEFGFDIVAYEGTGDSGLEIPHSLGVKPEMIVVKRRDVLAQSWVVYHHYAATPVDPETDYGVLNTTAVWTDSPAAWNDTAPTSTHFTLGNGTSVNVSGSNYVAYLFASVPQFSFLFRYVGTGTVNGPYVQCGFRPRWIWVKCMNYSTDYWWIVDTEREPGNSGYIKTLYPNAANVENDTAFVLDVVSTGFKHRGTHVYFNRDGYTFVGIAFAGQPVKYSNAF